MVSGFYRQSFIREVPASGFFVVAVSMVHKLVVGVVGQLCAVLSPAVNGGCIKEDGVFLAKEIKFFADAWLHQAHIVPWSVFGGAVPISKGNWTGMRRYCMVLVASPLSLRRARHVDHWLDPGLAQPNMPKQAAYDTLSVAEDP